MSDRSSDKVPKSYSGLKARLGQLPRHSQNLFMVGSLIAIMSVAAFSYLKFKSAEKSTQSAQPASVFVAPTTTAEWDSHLKSKTSRPPTGKAAILSGYLADIVKEKGYLTNTDESRDITLAYIDNEEMYYFYSINRLTGEITDKVEIVIPKAEPLRYHYDVAPVNVTEQFRLNSGNAIFTLNCPAKCIGVSLKAEDGSNVDLLLNSSDPIPNGKKTVLIETSGSYYIENSYSSNSTISVDIEQR